MVNIEAFERLDPVLFESSRNRLRIVAVLAPMESRSRSFKELKEFLGLTDGNLSVHMRVLEENGYVSVQKSFVNRKPRTEYSLTPLGRQAFQEFIRTLGEIVTQSQALEQDPAAAQRETLALLQQGLAPAK
jgi:DNA-binding MarR family transcriptional regulator